MHWRRRSGVWLAALFAVHCLLWNKANWEENKKEFGCGVASSTFETGCIPCDLTKKNIHQYNKTSLRTYVCMYLIIMGPAKIWGTGGVECMYDRNDSWISLAKALVKIEVRLCVSSKKHPWIMLIYLIVWPKICIINLEEHVL